MIKLNIHLSHLVNFVDINYNNKICVAFIKSTQNDIICYNLNSNFKFTKSENVYLVNNIKIKVNKNIFLNNFIVQYFK